MNYFKKKIYHKHWVLTLLGSLFTVLAINSTFLYITDTYSIANSKPKQFFSVPNQKYLITEYVLDHKNNYDTFIFGSSRVGSINPYMLKNKKAYNMTYGEGIPHEHLVIIKLLLKKKVQIKHLLIGLDNFSYQVSFAEHQQSFIPKSHYLATDESMLDFYKFYFFRKPKSSDIKHFKKKFLNNQYPKDLIDDVYKTIFEQDKKFPKHASKYTNHNKNTNSNYVIKLQGSMDDYQDSTSFKNTINDMKEIVEIAKENNIDIKIFINPLNKNTFNYVNKELLNKFKEELSYITPYYDFTIPNELSNNENNWHDLSHFNMYVGDMILSRIYDNNTSIKDFGIYVDKREKE